MSDSRSIQHWHGATDIPASRGQLPVPSRGEPALTSPSQLKMQTKSLVRSTKGEESCQQGLAFPGADLPAWLWSCGGPQKSALEMVFSAWLFPALRKPSRTREKTSLMGMGVLLPAGNDTQGNSAAQR